MEKKNMILTDCKKARTLLVEEGAYEGVKRVAQKLNAPCIYLGDLGEMDEMKAVGLFEHSGVAAHPGDKGMSEIAKLILENM